MFEVLDENNAMLYAARNYDNPSCTETVEFYDDLKRFKYIKRLLNKYRETGDLKTRLLLAHIQILYNLFGQEPGTRLLFLKLRDYYPELIPFLVVLNRCPEVVFQIGQPAEDIHVEDVQWDMNVLKILQDDING